MRYDGKECESYKKDVSEKMKKLIKINNVTGQYTTVTEVEWCHQDRGPSYRCGCSLMTTLQDSNYELFGKTEKVKKSIKVSKRLLKLAALTNEIESRKGFVWKDVTGNHILYIWRGYAVDSLYLLPKN